MLKHLLSPSTVFSCFFMPTLSFLGVSIRPHPADRPVIEYVVKRLQSLWWNAHSIYLPVHTLLFILRLKKIKKNKLKGILMAVKGWAKSCLFGSLFAVGFAFGGYLLHEDVLTPLTPNTCMLWTAVSSCSIFVEANSRWSEISLYLLANFLEGMVLFLKKVHLIPDGFPKFSVSQDSYPDPKEAFSGALGCLLRLFLLSIAL